MRYLNKEQLFTNLRLGKPVEQWIGSEKKSNYTILKWLRIDLENSEYSISYFEVFDEGDKGSGDIYNFHTINADEPFGEIITCQNAEEAIAISFSKYNCWHDQYVNAGLIQDEYLEWRKKENL